MDTKNHHSGSKQEHDGPATTSTGQIVDETTIKDPQINNQPKSNQTSLKKDQTKSGTFTNKWINKGRIFTQKVPNTIKRRDVKNYYDILKEDETIKHDNQIVPQLALDMRYEDLKKEKDALTNSIITKDKQFHEVEKESILLKKKITDIDEGMDAERMSLHALEKFLAADHN